MNYLKAPKHNELKPEDLRWKCDPRVFEFESTGDLEPIEGILGQERALKALKLGIELRSPGYNIFITGLSGTGKATTIKNMLQRIGTQSAELYDYAYVNNFEDPDYPILLKFKKGEAKYFRQELSASINILRQKIPQALEGNHFINRKKKLINVYQDKEQNLMTNFEEKLSKDGFTLGQVKIGEVARPDILPIIDNKPVPVFQLEELVQQGSITKEQMHELLKKYNEYQQEFQIVYREGLKITQEFQDKIAQLEKESIEIVVKGVIENLKEQYSDKKVLFYLDQIQENILSNIPIFKGQKPQGEVSPEGLPIDYFKEYEVNVILDNSNTNECPIIIETSPTHTNLFGMIEKINDGKGGWYSDFTNIKAGSLLKANGGYLVLNVYHLFEEPGVWKTLKRVLTYHKLEVQDIFSYFQVAHTSIKPEPIDINTKVILIGSQLIYAFLAEREYDFKKMFKIKADFDYEITRTDNVLVEYARVIKKLIKDEQLREFDKDAIARLVEIGAIFAGSKYKLTLRFSKIADIAREANFWAGDDGTDIVTAYHVERAYQTTRERHGLLETKISEMFDDNTLLIDVEGQRVGQINGLAVYNADFYSFGRPTRITATVSLGSGTIINVEREAGMSGRHYNKGVLIISGYFRETFGQELPLSFNANLVFEQSYGTVDGDSASCAEIFALLSTLSGLPIKQSIAVTGSLNQKGDVQPIGGVNEKVEGFYDFCKSRRLTGEQGVIIPIQNVKELMLRDEIIEAVRTGKFHIYAISRVEEGIEILTGVASGIRKIKGYAPNSVFYLVEKKIKDLYAKARAIKPLSENNQEIKRLKSKAPVKKKRKK
ncbi:MAG: AAA family ATPase [Ignavibacteriaceae bacterium]|nr:AAA family ATPase [Ignavibacteriaceae bacterium]